MPITNTPTTYGAVTKSFHWLTALLILAAIPLGYFANDLAHQVRDPDIAATDAQVARATLLFSLHKTVGVAVFLVALLRILWALSQRKPGLLNGDKRAEAGLAATMHWLLYGSLLLVPLSGWIHHAATTGFAPIWWPFGQSLPFVPKDAALAGLFATLHHLFQWVLFGALALHITGALKHHLLDRDATLRRMLPGETPARPAERQPGHAVPVLAALVVWGATLGTAGALGWFAPEARPQTVALDAVESGWQVQEGRLEITVSQMGSEVTGRFADWTADITYAETPDAEGRHGAVTVTVAIPSLSLGSVTDQAMGSEFFDAENHPRATFEADILSAQDGHVARGTLTIKGQSVPVEMPFDLALDGDTARAQGGLTVDRRDFNIGLGTTDEGTLGFTVDISFELTAQRA
jgi:cytochrome b561/polyisoprenoid-binding protein YceI